MQRRAKRKPVVRVDYHNPGSEPVSFILGTTPEDAPEEVTVQPGETYKGYENYRKFYLRNGLAVGKPPTAAELSEKAKDEEAKAAKALEDAESLSKKSEQELAEEKNIIQEKETNDIPTPPARPGLKTPKRSRK